ncbi:MAG: hypothetical protein IPH44_07980 [Myxococcales bacterium]|nr:hypothetical protein [Myxococcales bacterium]MBK7198487.1 hypothetical protein [Myxococcales bacterium]
MSIVAVPTADGHVAVVADGRLSLYELEHGMRVAAVEVVGDRVVACGGYLLVHAHDNLASLLTLFSTPDLTAVACVELAAPTRLLAATGGYALVDRGDQAFIAQVSGGNLAVVPLRPPATFDQAYGLDGGAFLTFGRRGAESWDASQRTPTSRLALALPDDTKESGVTLRSSSLWVATGQASLTTMRLSDGRASVLKLDAAPRRVHSHRAVGWITAQVGADDVAINLAVRVIEPLDRRHGPVIGLTPVKDREACATVLWLDGDRLQTHLLGGEAARAWSSAVSTTIDDPARAAPPPASVAPPPPAAVAAPPTPPEPAAPPRAQTVSERLAARLGRGAPGGTAPIAAPAAAVTSAPTPTPAVAPTPAIAPTSATIAPAPTPATIAPTAPPATAPPATPPARAALRPAPPASPPTAAGEWRDELLAWAAAPTAPPPPLADTSLRALGDQLGGPTAWPVLCALYAAWLRGDAGVGTAIATLAALTPSAPDRWAEALGTGALGRLGVARWERGRARLTAAAGEFLDGLPPLELEALVAGPPRAALPGLFRLDLDAATTPRMGAYALAEQLGVVAWANPARDRVRAGLAQARLEAWLRGLVVVTPHDVSAAELRPGECVIWLARPGAADHPAAPPPWPMR